MASSIYMQVVYLFKRSVQGAHSPIFFPRGHVGKASWNDARKYAALRRAMEEKNM